MPLKDWSMTARPLYRFCVAGALALQAAAPGIGQSALPADAAVSRPSREARVRHLMAQLPLPGVTATVVSRDRVIWEGAFGVREAGGSAPMTPDTVMCVGSLSKGFTAVALGVLVDDGALKWDDVVGQRMRAFRLRDPALTNVVTVRDLLAHRVGVEDSYWYPTRQTRPELVRRLRHLPGPAAFRSSFVYSNMLYSAAGEVAAAVSPYSWDTLLAKRVFEPAGMRSASTTAAGLLAAPDHAASHVVDLAGRLHVEPIEPVGLWDMSSIGPAGSINASLRDMQRWSRLLLGEGQIDGRRIIRSTTLAEIFTPQNFMRENSELTDKIDGAYGLGWAVEQLHGTRVVWHSGLVQGHASVILLLPEKDRAIFVASNSEVGLFRGDALVKLALELAEMELDQPFVDRTVSAVAARAAHVARVQADLAKLEAEADPGISRTLADAALIGAYTNPAVGNIVVEPSGKELRVRFTDARAPFFATMSSWRGDSYRLTPNYVAAYYWPGQIISFRVDLDGKVVSATIHNRGNLGNSDIEFLRAGPSTAPADQQ